MGMTYEEAKKLLLNALNTNPAAHAELEEALETCLFEATKAAGPKHLPPEPGKHATGTAQDLKEALEASREEAHASKKGHHK